MDVCVMAADHMTAPVLLVPWPGEIGYGDAIENARLVPVVAAHSVPGTTLGVRRALVRLFSGLGMPVVEQESLNRSGSGCLTAGVRPGTRLPSFDDLPFPAPLWTDPGFRQVPLPADARLRVGLCWHGSGGGRSSICLDDDFRCVPPAQLRPLLDVPDVAWIGLQLADHARALPIPGLDTLSVRDFADTAGLMQQLDLVITIDTSVAHLAGNLCVPTWLLLISPQARGWDGRWSRTPPLYATVRQFRQPAPGDWTSVVAQVREELQTSVPHLQMIPVVVPDAVAPTPA
jgi:hypothetical protein